MLWKSLLRVLATLFVLASPVRPVLSQSSDEKLQALEKVYWGALGFNCPDCGGSGKFTCPECHGVDKASLACPYCHGVDQTSLLCSHCRGVDQTKLTCDHCRGIDRTQLPCSHCRGVGRLNGQTCFWCFGRGHESRCAWCFGTGHRPTCAWCQGLGHRPTCFFCRGTGRQSPCSLCGGKAINGPPCETCEGHGSLEVISMAFRTPDDLLRAALADAPPHPDPKLPSVLTLADTGRLVAENGSYFGEISAKTGRPKVVFVNGYWRHDGTYVRSHYRSLPLGAGSARGPPLRVQPFYEENGSYYGQLNAHGIPKTVHVNGYFRKDGTYVRSHVRAPPSKH